MAGQSSKKSKQVH